MADKSGSAIIEALLKGMDTIISTKTVVGEPTKIDDTIILPLVDVAFGLGAGSSAGTSKGADGGGLSGKLSPSAVLVIKNGQTKLVNIKNQDAVTKVLDMIPDVFDKVSSMIKKEETPTDEEVVEAAFPEEK